MKPKNATHGWYSQMVCHSNETGSIRPFLIVSKLDNNIRSVGSTRGKIKGSQTTETTDNWGENRIFVRKQQIRNIKIVKKRLNQLKVALRYITTNMLIRFWTYLWLELRHHLVGQRGRVRRLFPRLNRYRTRSVGPGWRTIASHNDRLTAWAGWIARQAG